MPNPVVHFEIDCSNGERPRTFSEKLFDWKIAPKSAGHTIETGAPGTIGGHLAELAPEWGAYVTVYVEVDDQDAYLEKVNALGRKTLVPPVDLPGPGSFAGIAAPEGNILGLWKSLR